ncbi:hypothetical protein V1358_08080 [Pseudoalteromonas sp. YIC-656]|uniref:hypothetical protein n=1 Tax=Pseudoalteromonas pernae TaxID=3118054 RepID=UPI003241FD4F
MLDFIVHLGRGKTGSTSIQDTLRVHREELIGVGINYVGLNFEYEAHEFQWQRPNGWSSLKSMKEEDAISQLSKKLKECLRHSLKKGYKTVVWSNESLLQNSKIVIPALSSINQNKINIKFVVYVRNYSAWIQSAYCQWSLKHKTYKGPVQSFQQWSEKDFSLGSVLRAWGAVPDTHLYLRNMDSTANLVDDFISLIGGPVGIEQIRNNDAPQSVALALWAIYNSQITQPVPPIHLKRLLDSAKVTNKKYMHVDLQGLGAKPSDLAALEDRYSEDLNSVNELLLSQGQEPLSNDSTIKQAANVSTEQLIAGLLDICKSNYEQIQELKSEINQLKRN